MEFQGMYDCEIMVSYPVSLLALTWSTQPYQLLSVGA